MTTYYKATRPDGTDFRTGTINYAAALASGELVTHPDAHRHGPGGYLSVSVAATACTGFSWPCRLFIVEPVDPWTPEAHDLPSKRACHALRVVEERPAHEVFGPNGSDVVAIIDRAAHLTDDEARRLSAARDAARDAATTAATTAARDAATTAARDAAWDAAWIAAWDAATTAATTAAWDAAWDAAWIAAWDAAWAVLVRDLITPEQYEKLVAPWNSVIGGAE